MNILEEIYGRMIANEEFEFGTLHRGLPAEAYRLADKTLQTFRRSGFAAYHREGRRYIWRLTDAGKAFISAKAGA